MGFRKKKMIITVRKGEQMGERPGKNELARKWPDFALIAGQKKKEEKATITIECFSPVCERYNSLSGKSFRISTEKMLEKKT